jgi:hypothetical protein
MEPITFWREQEQRFRELSDPLRQLKAARSGESPAEMLTIWRENLALVNAKPGDHVDAINSLEQAIAQVSGWLERGEHIMRWNIVVHCPSSDAMMPVLKQRFLNEAALAAVAAEVVPRGTTFDVAVDAWLDFLATEYSPFYDRDARINDLAEASAVMCTTLATRAYTHRAPNRPDPRELSIPLQSSIRISNWPDLEIRVLSDHRVHARANGADEYLNYADFGFEDKRTGNPTKAWETLLLLAHGDGVLPIDRSVKGYVTQGKRIEEIRRVLRTRYGCAENPVPALDQAYRTSFKIVVSAAFDS